MIMKDFCLWQVACTGIDWLRLVCETVYIERAERWIILNNKKGGDEI